MRMNLVKETQENFPRMLSARTIIDIGDNWPSSKERAGTPCRGTVWTEIWQGARLTHSWKALEDWD